MTEESNSQYWEKSREFERIFFISFFSMKLIREDVSSGRWFSCRSQRVSMVLR